MTQTEEAVLSTVLTESRRHKMSFRVDQLNGEKYLILDGLTGTHLQRIWLAEGVIADLILFLQTCGETWKRSNPALSAPPVAGR